MPTTSRRLPRVTLLTRVNVVAAFALSLAACDPTPDYPPFDPTLPGKILTEADFVARDDAAIQFAGGEGVSLVIPAGAVPAGTRVKVRNLVEIELERPISGKRLVYAWMQYFGYSAIEILPESLVLALPATLSVSNFVYNFDAGVACVSVLFARPTDTVWQPVREGIVVSDNPRGVTTVTASLDRGGVWSLAYTAGCPAFSGGADAGLD